MVGCLFKDKANGGTPLGHLEPSGSFDTQSIQALWDCYNVGEAVFDGDGHQTGIKPPLRLVEQHFQACWC